MLLPLPCDSSNERHGKLLNRLHVPLFALSGLSSCLSEGNRSPCY